MYQKMFNTYLKKAVLFCISLVVVLGLAFPPGDTPALADPPEPYIVKDIAAHNLTNVNGELFFSTSYGDFDSALWKSDNTNEGTLLVKVINPGGFSTLHELTEVNSRLFFVVGYGGNNKELWVSDGTEEGTVHVNPGVERSPIQELTDVNGILFYFAGDGAHGYELWKSDGTEEGTLMVKDINPGGDSSSPGELTNVNGTLYFYANDGVHGIELWKSDGTEAGTVMVKDIYPGNQSSWIGEMTDVNGTLYFRAWGDDIHRQELWKSDGTEEGTVMVKDILPGINDSFPMFLTNVNGTLFFSAYDEVHGRELWKSQGTEESTVLVKDLRPDNYGSEPDFLTNVKGKLYFSADDGISGRELWMSDGTEEGTILVKDIKPGNDGSYPERLTNVNGILFFSADDGVYGIEPRLSIGNETSTFLIADISPGDSSSWPLEFTQVNGRLFFTASDEFDRKLWALDYTNPIISSITPNTAIANTGDLPVTITGINFSTPISTHINGVTLLNPTLVSDTTLNAVVPVDSLEIGLYDLVVISNGETAILSDAFTIGLAGPWYVATSGDDGDNCLSPGTPCATINGVLNKPGFLAGSTVLVAKGEYTGTGSEVVKLNKSVTLSGGWDSNFTTQSGTSTIDGEDSRRGIIINESVTAAVDYFTVQHGYTNDGNGGGIYNSGTFTLTNSTITDNFAYYHTWSQRGGGGIYNIGVLTLLNSTVSNNSASLFGGGIFADSEANTVIMDSRIYANYSLDQGGGIASVYANQLSMSRSWVVGNEVPNNDGGGISVIGSAHIENSIIAGNTAGGDSGGGLWLTGGRMYHIVNSHIVGNETSGEGGAIATIGTMQVVITNTLIISNTGNTGITDREGDGSIFLLNYCDTYGNSPDGTSGVTITRNNCLGSPQEDGLNPMMAGGALPSGVGPDYAHEWLSYDYRLLPDSPAIDAGTPVDAPATDIEGNPRDATPDLGAYEMGNSPPSISGAQAGQHVDDKSTINPFTGVNLSDADKEDKLTVILSMDDPDKGDLTNLGGFVEGPNGTYTFVGSPISATTAIRGLTFAPTDNRKVPGGTDTTTFTISADDGTAGPVTDDTTTVIATSINDLPTISGTQSGQKVDDNNTIKPFTTVTISDPDVDASLVVKIKVEDDDTGELTNLGSFVKVDDDTYKFIGSPSAATTVIRNITFVPNENRLKPGNTEKTTFIIRADDGIAEPVIDKDTSVIVTSINDKPTISGTIAGQTVDDNDTIKPFGKVVIADPDKKASLTVIVQMDDDHKGELKNLNGFVEGPDGTYTFLGNPAAATSVIQGLKFVPEENHRKPGNKETAAFSIYADDGIADPVMDDTTTVIVTSINDAPTIGGTQAGQVVAGGATIDPFAGVSIIDPDKKASLTVIVSMDNPDTGELTNLGGFVESPNGIYTFMGSPAEATTALQGLTFIPMEGRVPPGQSETTKFTISADDGIAIPVVDDNTTVIVRMVVMTNQLFMPLILR